MPSIVERSAQPYVAIRADLTMADMKEAADRLFDRLLAELCERRIATTGAPFIKYNRIDMAETLEKDAVRTALTIPCRNAAA